MYVLASASPRRKELMALLCDGFTVDIPTGKEVFPSELPARERPQYLACRKAREVAERHTSDSVIIAADTAVFIGDTMLGKPKNAADAQKMLGLLSDNVHTVITGCCVIKGDKCEAFSSATDVTFYRLSESEIEKYVATGEPLDKAGAYGIQGRGALLVREIHGDYFNVVGLPVAALSRVISSI